MTNILKCDFLTLIKITVKITNCDILSYIRIKYPKLYHIINIP